MIFATVGTQAPFDRFIKLLDEIAPEVNEEIIAQTCKGEYQVKHIKTVDFLPPDAFNELFSKARIIIAHAGMGTVISALKMKKPIIIMPRIASWGEHRNDHQIATAMKLDELGYVYAAYDGKQLKELLMQKEPKPLCAIGDTASRELTKSLEEFIQSKR